MPFGLMFSLIYVNIMGFDTVDNLHLALCTKHKHRLGVILQIVPLNR